MAEAAFLDGDPGRALDAVEQALEVALRPDRRSRQWLIDELAYWRWRAGGSREPPEGTAGLPVGVQLVGPLWSEPRLLGIARELERAGVLPGFRAPPGFSS